MIIFLIPIVWILILLFINNIQLIRPNYNEKTMHIDKTFGYNNLRMEYESNCETYGGRYNHKITTLQEDVKTTTIIFVSSTCTIDGILREKFSKENGFSRNADNIVSKDLLKNIPYKVYYYKGSLKNIDTANHTVKKYIKKSKLIYES